MHYFIILTKECNLFCAYCSGGSDTPPREIQYRISDLQSFLAMDRDPVLEFYGGEPLLRVATMREMMDAIPGRYVIQTNGIFLDRLEQDILRRVHSVLVSVDGTVAVTDRERGDRVYERVLHNVESIRRRGFGGDLIARMTVVQGSRIYDNVRHLLDTGLFDHVHWQLDFGMFWEAGDATETGLGEWVADYNSGVSKLVEWWVGEMGRTGKVPGIVPFVGVMNSLLRCRPSALRCGSGLDFFTIMPDGRISACPVAIDSDFAIVGSIYDSSPTSIIGRTSLGEPCQSCGISGICGGRCLFVNRSQDKLRKNGYFEICRTVEHLVAALGSALPQVRALLASGTIGSREFDYPELNNGCEIIP